MWIFNGSTTASPILFGVYDAGLTNVQEAARISPARRFLINTTTDAGFRLDVNGTSRIFNTNTDAQIQFSPSNGAGQITLNSQSVNTIIQSNTGGTYPGAYFGTSTPGSNTNIGTALSIAGGGINYYSSNNGAQHSHRWFHNLGEQMRLAFSGNLLIGTSTDAGFRLDVNGTARVQGITTISTAGATTSVVLGNSSPNAERVIDATGYVGNRAAYRFININGGTLEACANNLSYANSWSCGSQGNIGLILTGSTGTAAAGSSVLDMRSTTQGFLPPRMTTAQKNAIPSPATGLVLYDTTLNKLCVFTGVNWETVTSV